MKLSRSEKMKFASIIFESKGRRRKIIDSLDFNELETLRGLYAQKMVFETVNGPIPLVEYCGGLPPRQQIQENPGLMASFFWCFYPENHRDQFDISSSLFVKRALYPFCFWNSGFFEIQKEKMEVYGFIWLVLTHVVTLSLATTMAQYYLDPIQYSPDYGVLSECIFLSFLFRFSEPFIHSCFMGCFGSDIITDECLMLSGYSLVLYIFPTVFCLIPSLYLRLMLLSGQALLRLIFLFQNYSTKLESKHFFLFVFLAMYELIYSIVVYRSLFLKFTLGYGFSEAFTAVFGSPDQSNAGTVQPPTSHLLLRNFVDF